MSLLTWALGLALMNALALFKEVAGPAAKNIKLREFKRRVSKQLTVAQQARMEKERHRQLARSQPIADVVGADYSIHAITPNSQEHSTGKLACYLGTLRGFSKKARLGARAATEGFMWLASLVFTTEMR
ncbi:unnamed protein product [Phytophthora fragariaefolia]|uniref:Unnamed protein product n=1 Tax=Phytophthora fragariaefolia TaxID=1490495 RepID=A0A9W6XRV1_9STRA|nr:unnamed protein product [Phytophthora fragariaefolia]